MAYNFAKKRLTLRRNIKHYLGVTYYSKCRLDLRIVRIMCGNDYGINRSLMAIPEVSNLANLNFYLRYNIY